MIIDKELSENEAWDFIVTDRGRDNLRVINKAYENRELGDRFMPAIYQIEPTNDCNLDCIMCPSRMISQKTYMPFDMFRKVVDEIADYARGIRLSYLGEPLLHPRLIDMIGYAKSQSRAKVTLFTNATLLTHKMSVDIVHSGVDEIVFSVDGATPSSFEMARRGARFEDVVRNIEDFLLFKGGRKPTASVNFVKLKINEPEVGLVKDYWSNYGCEVHVSRLCTWSGQLGIEALSGNGSEREGDLSDRCPCAELWYKAVIDANGHVLLCCNDFSSVRNFGNVKDQAIATLWNGDAIRDARAWHLGKQSQNSLLCSSCSNWSTVKDMEGYMVGSSMMANRP